MTITIIISTGDINCLTVYLNINLAGKVPQTAVCAVFDIYRRAVPSTNCT